jgi:hypothetical protein
MIFKRASLPICLPLFYLSILLLVAVYVRNAYSQFGGRFDRFTGGNEVTDASVSLSVGCQSRQGSLHRIGVSYSISHQTYGIRSLDVSEYYTLKNNVDIMSTFTQELGVSQICVPKTDTNTIYARYAGASVNRIKNKNADVITQCVRFTPSAADLEITLGQKLSTRMSTCRYHCLCICLNDIEASNHVSIGIRMYRYVFASPVRVLVALIRYVESGIKYILTLFTPLRSTIWPLHICRLNLLTIHCCFMVYETTTRICRRIKADMLRNMFRSHDFEVFQVSLCNVRQFTALFIMASHLARVKP